MGLFEKPVFQEHRLKELLIDISKSKFLKKTLKGSLPLVLIIEVITNNDG